MAVRHLIVKLTANTDAMSAGLSRGQKEVVGFTTGVNGLGSRASAAFKSIGVSLNGLVAGLTAGAFVAAVKSQMTAIDELGDAAERLAIDPSRLAGLGHAADQTGSSAEVMTAALERMNRAIAQASTGSGAADKTLARLGLTADRLVKMRADEAFYAVAESIARLPTSGEQAAAAFEIFGRQGTGLLNTLRLGSEGLAQFQEDARRLGIAFSAEDIARVSDANDALDQMGKSLRSIAGEVAIGLSPAIERFAKAVTDWNSQSTEGSDLAKQIQLAADALEFAGRAVWVGANAIVGGLMEALAKASAVADKIPGVDLTSTIALLDSTADQYWERIDSNLKEMDELVYGTADTMKEMGDSAGETGEGLEAAAAAAEKMRSAVMGLKGPIGELEKALGGLSGEQADGYLIGSGLREVIDTELAKLADLGVEVPAELRSSVSMIGRSQADRLVNEMAVSAGIDVPEAFSVEDAIGSGDERLAAFGRIVDIITDAAEQTDVWAKSLKDAEERMKGQQEAADKLNEQYRSAEEQLTFRFLELQDLATAGLISPEVAQKALTDDAKRLGITGEREVDAPTIKRAGSQEAYAAILKHQEAGAEKTPEWAAKMIEILGNIAAATETDANKLPDDDGPIFR